MSERMNEAEICVWLLPAPTSLLSTPAFEGGGVTYPITCVLNVSVGSVHIKWLSLRPHH